MSKVYVVLDLDYYYEHTIVKGVFNSFEMAMDLHNKIGWEDCTQIDEYDVVTGNLEESFFYDTSANDWIKNV